MSISSNKKTGDWIAHLPYFFQPAAITAHANYNRWLVPPAAVAIHLSIGMAYGFSVFWLPLSRAVGISESIGCPAGTSIWQEIFLTNCDWRISTLGWMYTLFFLFLGLSAAILGPIVERVGPRTTGLAAAVCWCGGLVISALGIHWHQGWMLWLGSGVIGGIGLGLGYISPVSTLIKWFPDRRGLATGMAIMGFGGGAMIGSPLADMLMKHFASADSVGVAPTFLVLAAVYFIYMVGGSLLYRLPPADWRPKGWVDNNSQKSLITRHNIHVSDAWRTPQFWLLWAVLFLNVTAGIGLIGIASPMLQEIFAGKLLGLDKSFAELNATEKASIATIAAGFTGLLSLFNILGRFFWSSSSDWLGRKLTYAIYFTLGFILYVSLPTLSLAGEFTLFVLAICIILSMYGGGFATIPAYLSDLFGTKMVGAIHGRLLTAWAMAGIFGPVIVNYMREYQLNLGMARSEVYNQTMYVLSALLAIGFIANILVRPVRQAVVQTSAKKFANLAKLQPAIANRNKKSQQKTATMDGNVGVLLVLTWGLVLVPLAWGIYRTVLTSAKIFNAS